ncbi:hypothetical protein HDA31_003741 [Micromonospora carbonacea subsp. aurantiaca]|nr:hypothetical protein [Micromonospora carbonacea]
MPAGGAWARRLALLRRGAARGPGGRLAALANPVVLAAP